ncbi:hypothetical protein FLLO111716_09130 [Flavobacterium longum]|uniref:hypothetical protein n=1 Tax=Flavobacterium longum TaxID=1299340 RepID=UPI0039E74586
MTRFTHEHPGHELPWPHESILDNDLERLEHDRNFAESDVYNSILDDEPTYHSLMNFPEEDQDGLYAHQEDDVFDDRDSYKEANRDDVYYFI